MKETASSPHCVIRRATACLVACALSTACTTTQRFDPATSTPVTSVVRIGDDVTCTLRDGSRETFHVTAVESTALSGDTRTIALAEITQLEVTRYSRQKTAALVGVVLVGGLAVAVAHNPPSLVSGPILTGPK